MRHIDCTLFRRAAKARWTPDIVHNLRQLPGQVVAQNKGILKLEVESVFLALFFVGFQGFQLGTVRASGNVSGRKVEGHILSCFAKLLDLLNGSRLSLTGRRAQPVAKDSDQDIAGFDNLLVDDGLGAIPGRWIGVRLPADRMQQDSMRSK